MSSIKTPNSKFNLINDRVKYGTDSGINVDSSTLVVNPITMRVGINTLTPTSSFDVSASTKYTSIIDYSNSTGNNTQNLTKVNGENLWSYPGYNFNASNIFSQQTVDLSAIILNDTTSIYKYAGGVLAPNGKIYCIPLEATNVGIIDPNNDTIDTSTISGLPSGFKYLGGVLAPNGKIYCIPNSATNIAIIDPINNTIDTTTISMTTYPNLSAVNKFWGGVLAPNGKIYCVPRSVSYVGIIDPVNNTFDSTSITFTSSQSGATSFQYATCALGSNGNIYFCPFSATHIMRLRPSDNNLNFISTIPESGFGSGKWYGSACGPDGNVYFMPFNNGKIIRVDISSETWSNVFTSGLAGSTGVSSGATLGLDGKIYGISNATNSVANNRLLFYDVIDSSGGILNITTNNNTEKWVGGVLAPNGLIYMIPAQYTRVATIKTGIPKLQPWMLAPEFNKF